MSLLNQGLLAGIVWLSGCVGTDIVNDSSTNLPVRIEITPETAAIEVGQTVLFQAIYFNALGEAVPTTVFQWQSSSPAHVSIDATGLATGREVGQVMVTASAKGIESEAALLTVVADPNDVAQIVATPDSCQLTIGGSVQLAATALNLSGSEIPGKTLDWRSSDEQIVTVDQTGLAVAIASGSAEIVAVSDGVESLPVFVEVLGQLRTGTFVRRPGTSYQVSGTATLVSTQSGGLQLNFGDDYSSSSGPGLEVFLSTSNRVNGTSLNLGRLKSTQGAQSYGVPSGVELSTFDWVIIHCVPFRVTFGFAELN